MFQIINLNDSYIEKYVFLTDVESIENQIFEIFDELNNSLGNTFSIIIDSFLRTGYDFNRFIEIKYNEGKYAGSLIVNYRDIPLEVKKKSEELLRMDINLLDESLLSKKTIEIIKSQLSIH